MRIKLLPKIYIKILITRPSQRQLREQVIVETLTYIHLYRLYSNESLLCHVEVICTYFKFTPPVYILHTGTNYNISPYTCGY